MAMPVMDGPATIQALRAFDPDLKIIGSSGLSSQGELANASGISMHGFIPKPYAAEIMLTTLADVLRGAPRTPV
jgi:DNA-binding NarL/FixJ family response regulator